MGKRIFAIVFALILLTSALYAQSSGINAVKRPFGYVSVSVGPSIPLSDFSSDNAYDNRSGYATLGYKVEADFGINIGSGFAIGLMGFANFNPTNIDSYISRLQTQNPGTVWTGESKTWEVFGGMGGFTFGYPAGKNLFLDFRALTGLISAKSPEIMLKYPNSNTGFTDSYMISENTSSAWSTLFSGSLSYQTSKNIMVTGGIEFLNSKPAFNNVETTIIENNITTKQTTSFSRQLNSLIFSAGVKYVFY